MIIMNISMDIKLSKGKLKARYDKYPSYLLRYGLTAYVEATPN